MSSQSAAGAGNGTPPAGVFDAQPLPGANFGGLVTFSGGADARAAVAAAEATPDILPRLLYDWNGFLFLRGMHAIADDAALLVRLSRPFGKEVENYRETLTDATRAHRTTPEILVVSNMPPVKRLPPARPNPPLTADGKLPTRFPQRRGWHTDQSYRRPPPDLSLFFAAVAAPKDQGQTLYANGILAYEALSPEMKERVENLQGIHAKPGSGRSENAVLAGEPAATLGPEAQPQRQPVVRVHPVTGQRALFMCESGQMDWIDGPFVGMEPGPHGDGAKLLYELMSHYTRPEFTYTHEWEQGDLVIYDNRSLIHAATWFDADKHDRAMWRTTVWGNPGEEYAGEDKSWTPKNRAEALTGG